MQRQVLPTAAGERVDRSVIPNVSTVAAVAPKLNRIKMGGGPDLVHEDELMLRPVERPHPCIALVPEAEVQKDAIDAPANSRNIVHVPPIDTHEVHGAAFRDLDGGSKGFGEERSKSLVRHLA